MESRLFGHNGGVMNWVFAPGEQTKAFLRAISYQTAKREISACRGDSVIRIKAARYGPAPFAGGRVACQQ